MAIHENDFDSSLKVKLQSISNPSERVIFNVTPAVNESQNVSYQPFQPVHTPGTVQVFTASGSRLFTLQPVRLVSRTPEEATRNLYILNLLRGWTKPVFGNSVENAQQTLGSGPAVLQFSAYSSGSGSSGKRGNINKVPVVISNLNITYPDAVDYIPTKKGSEVSLITPPPGVSEETHDWKTASGTATFVEDQIGLYANIDAGVPFPTVMQVDLSMLETHSPTEFANNFDLSAYKAGVLLGF